MKIRLLTLLFLACLYSFGQNNLYPTSISNYKEFNFHNVEKSKRELTEIELKNFEIIDTINKPYSLVIKNLSSIFIAVKNENKYNVYQLLTREENIAQKIEFNDTLKQISEKDLLKNNSEKYKLKIPNPKEICINYIQIKDKKNISLDSFLNDELILKFLNNKECCPTCSIPLNRQTSEGYIIFDFDKLQVLEITTRWNIRTVSNGIPIKDIKVEFEKNYLKIGKRKYYYKNNKLIRK